MSKAPTVRQSLAQIAGNTTPANGAVSEFEFTAAGIPVASGDFLLINAISVFASTTVYGTYEVVLTDGTLQKNQFQFQTSATPLTNTFVDTNSFSENGYLVSVSFAPTNVIAPLGSIQRGALYVQAYLESAGGQFNTQIIGGYNSQTVGPSWMAGAPPFLEDSRSGPGYVSAGTISAPPMGDPPNNITAPANTIMKVRSFVFQLTTDATAGNRTVLALYTNNTSSDFYAIAGPGATVSASSTVYMAGSLEGDQNFTNRTAISNNENIVVTFPLPDVLITAGDFIQFLIRELDTGDQCGAITVYTEQWFVTT